LKEEEYNFEEILKGLEMPEANHLDFELPHPGLQDLQYEDVTVVNDRVDLI
jgi:hypothetical protein